MPEPKQQDARSPPPSSTLNSQQSPEPDRAHIDEPTRHTLGEGVHAESAVPIVCGIAAPTVTISARSVRALALDEGDAEGRVDEGRAVFELQVPGLGIS